MLPLGTVEKMIHPMVQLTAEDEHQLKYLKKHVGLKEMRVVANTEGGHNLIHLNALLSSFKSDAVE